MSRDPFPNPPGDAGEPDGSALPPAASGTGPEDDWEGPAGQGLYVTLPAEQLTLSGFAQGGASDTMAPGLLLAAVVGAVTTRGGAERRSTAPPVGSHLAFPGLVSKTGCSPAGAGLGSLVRLPPGRWRMVVGHGRAAGYLVIRTAIASRRPVA